MFVKIIAGGPKRDGAAARRWVAVQTYDVQKAAQDPTTSEAVLEDIAKFGTSRLVEMVVSNKGTSSDTLELIWDDVPNDSIRERIASNKNASPALLTKVIGFAQSPRGWGRLLDKAVRNPSLSAAEKVTYAALRARRGARPVKSALPRVR